MQDTGDGVKIQYRGFYKTQFYCDSDVSCYHTTSIALCKCPVVS